MHADGSTLWVNISSSHLPGPAGKSAAVVQVLDVTDARQAAESLARQAHHDSLTGLPNRTLLREHLSKALERARRASTRVAVFFIDLDDFKDVNDLHGHLMGDRLLVEVAKRLDSAKRASDVAARLGGDEFVVVCGDIVSQGDVEAVSARISAALRTELLLSGQEISVQASIGLVVADGSQNVDDVMGQADEAMYAAKGRRKAQRGRSQKPFVAAQRRTSPGS